MLKITRAHRCLHVCTPSCPVPRASYLLSLRLICPECLRNNTHVNTCRAARATGTIVDILTAAKTDTAQRIVQLGGSFAAEFSENLPFAPTRQIGTWAGIGHEKSRETKRGCHVSPNLGLWLVDSDSHNMTPLHLYEKAG